jgi:crotonobetainyl-CoA:carnitine CoA-transferase CaiB-like acyl-CoA transferase
MRWAQLRARCYIGNGPAGGQHLDISLLDTYFHYHEAAVQMTSVSDGALKVTRSGRHAYYVAPAGIFKSKSGYMIIAAVGQSMARSVRGDGPTRAGRRSALR